MKNITKPMKKQWFQWKTLQNQCFFKEKLEKSNKTNGNNAFSKENNKKAIKPMENYTFSMKNQ